LKIIFNFKKPCSINNIVLVPPKPVVMYLLPDLLEHPDLHLMNIHYFLHHIQCSIGLTVYRDDHGKFYIRNTFIGSFPYPPPGNNIRIPLQIELFFKWIKQPDTYGQCELEYA